MSSMLQVQYMAHGEGDIGLVHRVRSILVAKIDGLTAHKDMSVNRLCPTTCCRTQLGTGQRHKSVV